jgi:hypothetical protein
MLELDLYQTKAGHHTPKLLQLLNFETPNLTNTSSQELREAIQKTLTPKEKYELACSQGALEWLSPEPWDPTIKLCVEVLLKRRQICLTTRTPPKLL